jgi:hypothetical protein
LDTACTREPHQGNLHPNEDWLEAEKGGKFLSDSKVAKYLKIVMADEKLKSTYLDLLRAATRGDYSSVAQCLHLTGKPLNVDSQARLNFLFEDLNAIQSESHNANIAIPLKDVSPQLPDPMQAATVTDSADQSVETIALSGASYLTPEMLQATAIVQFADGKREYLLPTAVSFTAGSPSQLSLAFQNPQNLVPASFSGATIEQDDASLSNHGTLVALQLRLLHAKTDDETWYTHFVKVSAASKGGAAGGGAQNATPAKGGKNVSPTVQICAGALKPIAIATTTATATSDASGLLSAKIAVTLPAQLGITQSCAIGSGSTMTPTIAAPFTLSVSGADAQPDGVCLTSVKGKINLSAAGSCQGSLALTNFSDAIPVSISVSDSNGTALGSPITLRVIEHEVPKH